MAATETQYTVKVPLNPTGFPSNDKYVIWDESEGRFNLSEGLGNSCLLYSYTGNTSASSGHFKLNQLLVSNATIIEVNYIGNDSIDYRDILTACTEGSVYVNSVESNAFLAIKFSSVTVNANTIEYNISSVEGSSLGGLPQENYCLNVVCDGIDGTSGTSGTSGSSGVSAAGCYDFIIQEGTITNDTDIVFVMDESGSAATGWTLQLSGITTIVDELNDEGYFDGRVKVGVIKYSDCADTTVSLNLNGDYSTVHDTITGLTHGGGGTFLGNGLVDAYEELIGVSSRSGANKLIIITNDGSITDYNSDSCGSGSALTLATQIKAGTYDEDIPMTIMSIGIGSAVESQMNGLSSDPDSEYTFTANSFEDFAQTIAPEVAQSVINFAASDGEIYVDTLSACNITTISISTTSNSGCDVTNFLSGFTNGGYLTLTEEGIDCSPSFGAVVSSGTSYGSYFSFSATPLVCSSAFTSGQTVTTCITGYGSSGTSGTSGSSGTSGTSGSSGTSGTSGSSGTSGTSGSSGTSGTSGSSGTSGTSGSSGTSGTSGSSGTSGTSGSSGTSGTSGSSGTS